MSNYRPISLLITFCKVNQNVIHNRISRYLRANNILVPEQFRFRKGISTEYAAVKITDYILKSLNQKMHVGGIFCNLAKAFDCVNHEILLTKLRYSGIKGSTPDWFKSYLTEGKQHTEIKTLYTTQTTYSIWGNNRAWNSTGASFRTFALHNLYK
jgi:hypothetical protein